MSTLLAATIPLAIAAAVSPLLVVTVLYYLGGTRPILRAAAYVSGVTFLCVLVAGVLVPGFVHLNTRQGGQTHGWAMSGIYLIVGILLLLMAVVALVRKSGPRARQPDIPSEPAREVGKAFRNGFGLEMVNASSLPIFADGLNTIGVSTVGVAGKLWVTTVFILVMLCEIYVPVLAYAMAPRLVGGSLAAARAWLTAHLRAVTMAVGVVYGAYFLIKAAVALA